MHLGFCLRFSTLIGQIGRVPLFGAGRRRYIRSRLFGLAVTAFWRAFTASWRQKGKRKRIFPRAVRTTELPSNPSNLTFRNNQIQILQTSSTHATMAANVFQQDTRNTHGTRLSHARTRQSFSDTTHKKWSEWKTNRSVVITGRFRRERQGWGALKPSDLKMEKFEKKNVFFKIALRSQRSG